jgi:hypothetical protein
MAARTLTQAELAAEATERFGEDPGGWAFQCPNCGDIATAYDFREALELHPATRDGQAVQPVELIGQECIGRTLGALEGNAERGCNWTAYGLFAGPWTVTLPSGKKICAFPLAGAR